MPIVGSFAGASSRAYGLQTSSLLFSYDSIATTTAGSAVSNIEFTNIPQNYTHLQVRGIVRTSTNNGDINLQFNGDTSANYSRHQLYGEGNTTVYGYGLANESTIVTGYCSNATSNFAPFVLDILDYSNTNKYKTTRTICGYDANGSGLVFLYSGNWRSTNAITSIKFYNYLSYTFQQYSTISVYGIKG